MEINWSKASKRTQVWFLCLIDSFFTKPDIKDHGWFPNEENFGVDETFPDKIEKIMQKVDEDHEDYAIGCNDESDGGDNF